MTKIVTLETFAQHVKDSNNLLSHAAKTIRQLIIDRDNALSAASPEAVKTAAEEAAIVRGNRDIEASMELAQSDLVAAIQEAAAPPKIVKPSSPTTPVKAASPVVPEFPNTLADSTPVKRPNVTAMDGDQEISLRAQGYTIIVPK